MKSHENLKDLEWDKKEELVNYFLVGNEDMMCAEDLLELRSRDRSKSVGGDESKSSKSTPEFGKDSERFNAISKAGKKVDPKAGEILASYVAPQKGDKKAAAAPSPSKKSKLNLRGFSMDQIGKHNKEGDTWIVYHGFVYDVSTWIGMHPGGKTILQRYAGKDCTEDFKKQHPWVNPTSILDDKKIGYLKDQNK